MRRFAIALSVMSVACSGVISGAAADAALGAADAPLGAADARPGTPDAMVTPPAAALVVRGNRIEHADGTPFHGRGANLHDERSCSACSFANPNPAGVNR